MTKNLNNPAEITTSPGVLICDHFREASAYKVHRPKGTKDWLITYTISGKGQFLIDDHVQIVEKGDIAILKPRAVHQYATHTSSWEFVWSHFLPRETWIELLMLPECAKGLFHINIEQLQLQERILASFRRMIHDNNNIHFLSNELSMNALEEILLAVKQWSRANDKMKVDLRVQEVLQIFSENLKETHTLESISRQVSLSTSRISHLFREQVGDSIMATLLSMRLKQAARLLEFTNRSISEVAGDVGFSSPFYFTKQFSAFYGKNPRDFRKTLMNSYRK